MENKPICIIDEYGTKRWWVDSRLHREDGPAIENPDGHKQWWVDGKCHRLDGPAVEFADGRKFWCVNDHYITDEITKWAKENEINIDNLSEDDKLMIKLVWADYGK